MRWAVSERWYVVIEILLAGLGAVITAWVSDSRGLNWGIPIAIAVVIVLACRRFVLQTHEDERQAEMLADVVLSQAEYDDLDLEEKDEKTRYHIVPQDTREG